MQALRTYVRSRSPLLSEKSAVLIHLEGLVERKPVLVDLEAIELYDDAFGYVLPDAREAWEHVIGEIQWQCVKAAPKNEDVALKCFQSCLLKDDLEHARQVSFRNITTRCLSTPLVSPFILGLAIRSLLIMSL